MLRHELGLQKFGFRESGFGIDRNIGQSSRSCSDFHSRASNCLGAFKCSLLVTVESLESLTQNPRNPEPGTLKILNPRISEASTP